MHFFPYMIVTLKLTTLFLFTIVYIIMYTYMYSGTSPYGHLTITFALALSQIVFHNASYPPLIRSPLH